VVDWVRPLPRRREDTKDRQVFGCGWAALCSSVVSFLLGAMTGQDSFAGQQNAIDGNIENTPGPPESVAGIAGTGHAGEIGPHQLVIGPPRMPCDRVGRAPDHNHGLL